MALLSENCTLTDCICLWVAVHNAGTKSWPSELDFCPAETLCKCAYLKASLLCHLESRWLVKTAPFAICKPTFPQDFTQNQLRRLAKSIQCLVFFAPRCSQEIITPRSNTSRCENGSRVTDIMPDTSIALGPDVELRIAVRSTACECYMPCDAIIAYL